jgi:4-amino-4-deoxy-L-arabinose transferase-like glycosyltransferase
MPSSRRWLYGVLLLVFTAVWFGNLEYRHLIRPDEGRYAEIPREMALSGDWVTPRLNGIKYFEKPPLQYWATAAAYEAFGEHEWTARLWTGLTGWLGVLLAFFVGRRLFGETAGLFAALVLGGNVFYVLAGHFNSLDMGVSFFMGLTLSAFLLAQTARDAGASRNWMLVAWAAAALSLLSKGLIGIVLPGAVLVAYTLLARDVAVWRRLYIVPGLILFLLIAAPWFVAVSLANPEFAYFFFIHEHFQRFLTKVHGRYHPWYDFIPLLLGGIVPFLVSLFPALARAWSAERGERTFRPRLFLLLWSVVIFVFFSLSDSKLPGYILPIFPALALLLGDYLSQVRLASLTRQTAAMALIGVAVIGVAALNFGRFSVDEPLLYGKYGLWLAAAAAVSLAGMAASVFASRRGSRGGAVLALAFAGLVSTQLIVSGHESLAPINSGYDFAQKLRPLLRADNKLYCVKMYDQTLPFYLKRTCTLVAHEDEMAFGLRQEPQLRGPDLDTFLARFPAMPDAVAIMSPETYAQLATQSRALRVLVRTREHVAVVPE